MNCGCSLLSSRSSGTGRAAASIPSPVLLSLPQLTGCPLQAALLEELLLPTLRAEVPTQLNGGFAAEPPPRMHNKDGGSTLTATFPPFCFFPRGPE